MRRDRAPWWRRSLGPWGVACGVLVVVALALGFVAPRAAQLAVLGAAAVAYLVGLLRSPD